ncbi:MAG: D-glycerate dehydrogenase [Peptococcaceae bacterium]|nr:D-glycerate dehydrogenase [Peptococcaceae bacterium]MDH7524210.1 D-glycerate dehydrogenase [Peptococcaceae bacterium]
MKPLVYVTRRIPEEGLNILRENAEVKVWEGELPPPYEVLLEEIREVEGILCLLTDRIDRKLLEAGKKLRVVSNYAVGFDNIDIQAATEKGVMVTNTPDVLTETTADLAFALMMAVARRIVEGVRYVENGRWKTWSPMLLLGQDIHGSVLGLIGLGRIGTAVARRASGFGMKVLYHSRTRNEMAERDLDLTCAGLEELLRESDFVSLHVPLTDMTRGMINRQTLSLMKKSAVLINTARGAVVNEKDLYEALKEGIIWGAGLDVTDPEPMRADNPLLSLDNVVVVPHIGSASVVTRTRMAVMAARNMAAGLKGEKPPNLVNAAVMKG